MTKFTCILIDAKNPQWGNAEHTRIYIEAKFEHYPEEWGYLGFTADPNDVEAHGRDLYQRCVNGEFGTIAEYVAPPEPEVTEEQPSE
tara:strand:+ start:316 stop:576 length:261 start_codon:yes stop_codon:yes gene_type:complete